MRISAIAAVVVAVSIPVSAQTPEADGKRLIALCKLHCGSFDLIHGNSMYYGGPVDEARQALTALEAVEREILPEVQPVLAHFADTYGTTAMEVNNSFHVLGVRLDDNVGNRFDELYRGVANVRSSRKASAEQVLQRARMDTANMALYSPEIRVRKMKQARELLLVGHQLDPTNAGINEMLATVDADIEHQAAEAEAAIDGARWAGDATSFAGPGRPRDLATAALGYFRAHPNWGASPTNKVEILEVAIRGDWQVAETDLLGRVVSWRLPIQLAVSDPDLEKRKVVRVYELSAVTRVGDPGEVEQAPPFDAYWVGRSWLMRADKL